jgi:hypothetical protein
MSNVKSQFEKLLATFKKTTQQSMDAARALANIAIEQFADHGNLSYAQSFLEAMPKNYIRRAAFLKWLGDHAPITMDKDGHLVKDKSPNATELDVVGAVKTPFWEYAPDPEQVYFGAQDVVVALRRAAAKFTKDRYHAASDKARETLALVNEHLDQIENSVGSVDPDDEATTEDAGVEDDQVQTASEAEEADETVQDEDGEASSDEDGEIEEANGMNATDGGETPEGAVAA